MEIVLAQPQGFCAGVVRALAIVELALKILHRAPVYFFHEIVHNRHVAEDLQTRGAVFFATLDEVPQAAATISSTRGVSTAVVQKAREIGLEMHLPAQRCSKKGYEVIIGRLGHEQVDGIMGSASGPMQVVSTAAQVVALSVADATKLAYVTQTTLSQDDGEIPGKWLQGVARVGVTTGARRVPEVLVQRVLARLQTHGISATRDLDGIRETIIFNLPSSLLAQKTSPAFAYAR